MKKTRWIMALLCCLTTIAARAQSVAEVVKAYTRGKSIVVEYDLGTDADFVRLFVSLDGGVTYRGPLQQVSGDVTNVKAGFGHSLEWDVLKELEANAFDNDKVRFKLKLKMRERWPKETFVTLNAAYSLAPQASFGIGFGQVKRFGWFVSLMTNGSLAGFRTDGECNAQGFLPDGHLMAYTGETTKTRLSVMAGGLMRVAGPLMVRVGAGYGNRTLCWQTTDRQWLRNTGFSWQGLELSAGIQLHWHGLALSAEAVTTQFKSVEGKIGVGVCF